MSPEVPLSHRLNAVYRFGSGLIGTFLLVFGIVGLINGLPYRGLSGDRVLGLSNNGLLSLLSIVVGLILLGGMTVGGQLASTLNIVFGVLFLLSGFVNMAVLRTPYNYLGFEMRNVIFSFVVGTVLAMFGMYGRVSSKLPADNPFFRRRHQGRPEDAESGKSVTRVTTRHR